MNDDEVGYSDAWILVALCIGAGKPDQVIGAADAMNHAVPTPEEWAHACNTLGRRGFVQNAHPLPVLTPSGAALVIEAGAKSTQIYERIKLLVVDIQQAHASHEPVTKPSLEALQESFDAYSANMRDYIASNHEKFRPWSARRRHNS